MKAQVFLELMAEENHQVVIIDIFPYLRMLPVMRLFLEAVAVGWQCLALRRINPLQMPILPAPVQMAW